MFIAGSARARWARPQPQPKLFEEPHRDHLADGVTALLILLVPHLGRGWRHSQAEAVAEPRLGNASRFGTVRSKNRALEVHLKRATCNIRFTRTKHGPG